MNARRTWIVGCALALLIAAGVWLATSDPAALAVDPVANGEVDLEPASDRISVPKDKESAPGAPQLAPTARDIASAQEETALEDATLDQLTRDQIDESPRTSIHGRVLDPDGKPLEARVLVSTRRTFPTALLDAPVNQDRVLSCTSGTDGGFKLGDVEPGTMRIAVRLDGFAPLDAPELSVPLGESFDVGELRLQRGVIFAGRVLNPEQRPIAGATISLLRAPLLGPIHRLGSITESALGTSDEFGRFTLRSIALGTWTLRVSQRDFPDALFEVEALAELPRVEDLEFVLQPGASISGTLLEFDERATPGLSVLATPVDGLQMFRESRPYGASSEWLAGARSEPVDSYGRFCITGLDPGRSYSLRARSAANRTLESRELDDANSEIEDRWAPPTLATAGAVDVELIYLPGCRIDFEVVDRASGNDLENLNIRLDGMSQTRPLDEHGKPRTHFAGGMVTLLDVRASGAAQNYEPGNERDDTALATLTIEAPGHDTRTLAGLRLSPGERLDLGPVRLDSLTMLEVRVLDLTTHLPIAAARVALIADPPADFEGRKSSIALTRGNGLARLSSLPTYASTLSISAVGYGPIIHAAPAVSREGDQPLEVLLAPSASVTASVRDTRGALVVGSQVQLWRETAVREQMWSWGQLTDSRGIARFDDVPEGSFLIQAQPRLGFTRDLNQPGSLFNARKLLVKSGAALDVELEVAALSALSCTIWRGREPLAGATVSFSSDLRAFNDLGTDMLHFSRAVSVVTDSRGELSNVELAPGDYSLLIDQRDQGVRTRRIVRVEKLPTNVVIDVDDTQITGRVYDQRAHPVAQALVQLFVDRPGKRTDIRPSLGDFLIPPQAWRRPISETRTDANGDYCLSSVPPGIPLEMLFTSERRVASRPRVNAPQGRIIEHVDVTLSDQGSLEIVLAAPIAPPGRHYGVRIVALKHPEGLAVDGAVFDADNRARFADLPAGEWVVMVFELDEAEQVADRRKPQTVEVKSGETTEFSLGW